jgi:hypothetical protein
LVAQSCVASIVGIVTTTQLSCFDDLEHSRRDLLHLVVQRLGDSQLREIVGSVSRLQFSLNFPA